MTEVTGAAAKSSAKLQSWVYTMTGLSYLSAGDVALLEWGADDHIRLFKVEQGTTNTTDVLFDITLKDVKKLGGTTDILTLTFAGVKHRLEFTPPSVEVRQQLASMPGMSLESNYDKYGLKQWHAAFTAAGISTKGVWTIGRIFLLAGIISGVLIIGVVAFVVIWTIVAGH